jgi:hypothetical protein
MDSPDVEKEFPGLYTAEGGKSKKSENDCEYKTITIFL